MAKELKTGVLLSLKDGFSANIKKAGSAATGFANTTLNAVNKIDKAISGIPAKLGAIGVSLSVGGAVKDIIDFDHRLTRVGLTANASAEQIAHLKKEIYNAALSPDIKIDPTEILDGLDSIMTKTGDLKFAEANIKNLGLAIQAAGESGGAMGDVFAEFAKNKYSAQEITQLMDDMVAQSDQGEFTFAEFAKNAKGVLSAYSVIGNSADDVRRANAAMQILTAGTKSAEVATTVLGSAINELSDPEKREKIEKLGIAVRDIKTGKMRDFNDIMVDLAEASNDLAKGDAINSIFGSETIKAVRAYSSEYGKNLNNLLNLGDTAGKLADKSARMAGTLKSNIENIHTAFNSFIDGKGSGAIGLLNDALNKLSANPENIKKVFNAIATGLIGIAAIKGIAGISRLIGSISQLKSGKVNISESLNMASAMPVYVTNWGGGGAPMGGVPGGGLLDQFGNPISKSPNPITTPKASVKTAMSAGKTALKTIGGVKLAGGAAMGGIGAAIFALPQMFDEMDSIKENDELSDAEKSKAKGGAVGNATGTIIGAAAGGAAGIAASAALGAAIGSVIPGLGTAIGGIVGAAIGLGGAYLGGKAGRAIGEGIGGASSGTLSDEERRAMMLRSYGYVSAASLPPQITGAKTNSFIERQKVEFGGEAVMDVNVNISGDTPSAQVAIQNRNIRNMRFRNSNKNMYNAGHAPAARDWAP